MKKFICQFLFFISLAVSTNVRASEIPLIISTGAGGILHQYSIALQPLLQKWLDRTVVIDIRPGGNGAVAARTLTSQKRPAFMLAGINPTSPVDQLTEITPVAYMGSFTQIIFANANTGYTNFKQIVDSKKTVTYGTVNGNPVAANMTHYARSVTVQTSGQTVLQEVLYKSSADVLRDVVGNHVDIGVGATSTAGEMIRAGKLVAIASLGPARSKIIQGVPTLAEQGFAWANDFYMAHNILWASNDTPPEMIAAVRQNIQKWVDSPAGQDVLRTLDYELKSTMVLQPQPVIRAIVK